MNKLVINKAFFGKGNCLKATLNDAGEFIFISAPKKEKSGPGKNLR
jgi:hypothetical protein